MLSVNDFFKYCTEDLASKISFFLTTPQDIEISSQELKHRLEVAKTIPGTRSFHKLIPENETQIRAFHISSDIEDQIKYVTGGKKILDICKYVQEGSYVVCFYEGKKFIGIVESYNSEYDDYIINFMTPNKLSSFYTFPEIKDSFSVLSEHIIGILTDPEVKAGTSGLQYY